jgi:hypothetical protein
VLIIVPNDSYKQQPANVGNQLPTGICIVILVNLQNCSGLTDLALDIINDFSVAAVVDN